MVQETTIAIVASILLIGAKLVERVFMLAVGPVR